MKAWDVYSWKAEDMREAHPCVIVSHPLRVANKPEINILVCTSQRASRPPQPHEVLLDEADGLDWPTFCKCDLLRDVPKDELHQHRGHVTEARRRQIIATIQRSNDW